MLGGDLELLGDGLLECLGIELKSYEGEAASTILAEAVLMWHKVLRSKFDKKG